MGDSDTPAVDPSRPEYVYVQVADDIERQIRDGTLAPGAMLPGERALTEQYGVALNTVRGAVRLLRERGLVITVPAKGTFIAEPAE
jgi:DNA-binding GntR family transcriptional regulator